MNAVMRKTYEAIVESKEAIETHLLYLRKGHDDFRGDIRELRAERRSDMTEVRTDIKALHEKIDSGHAKLNEKIDRNHSETNAALFKLTESVSSLRGMQLALVWVIGIVITLSGVALTLGKILKWY